MSAPPRPFQFSGEELGEEGSWFARLILPQLNQFVQSVSAALDKGLSRADNSARQVKTWTGAWPADFPIQFPLELATRPEEVRIANASSRNASAWSLLDSVGLQRWEIRDGKTVWIPFVSGLTSGVVYTLEFVIE